MTQIKLKKNYQIIIGFPAEQVPRFFDFATGITVEPNFRVHPQSNSTQSELSIDVHPTNSNIVFASANATNWPVTTFVEQECIGRWMEQHTWSGADEPHFTRFETLEVILLQ